MIEYSLTSQGTAEISVWVQRCGLKELKKLQFTVDTGATVSVIPLNILEDSLGYHKAWISANKSGKRVPKSAQKREIQLVRLPPVLTKLGGMFAPEPTYFYTSLDEDLSVLLGMDILSRFTFTFNPAAVDKGAKFGKFFIEDAALTRKLLSKGVAPQHLNALIEEIYEYAPSYEKQAGADRDTVVMRIVDKYPIPEKYKRSEP